MQVFFGFTLTRLYFLAWNDPKKEAWAMAKGESVPMLSDIGPLEEVMDCMTAHLVIPMQGACKQQTLFEILAHSITLYNNIENTRKTLKDIKCRHSVVLESLPPKANIPVPRYLPSQC